MASPLRQVHLLRYLTRAGGPSWSRLAEDHARLARELAEAVEAHRAKSAFVAGLSHQLRTPLSTILLSSELLADDLADQGLDHLGQDVVRIQGAGKYLLSLLDDIIDLTRMEAGRMIFKREETFLPALAQKLAAALTAQAQQHGNTLEYHCDPALGTLATDETKLEQILFHLLDNALKFTHKGAVTLELRPCPEGGGVAFTVRDTGPGINPEQLERIRKDFAQTPDSRPAAFGTAGLGLTLCRRLAEGLGGQIQVESAPGAGSAFTLRLPAGP
jgi:signal transduction histidine kinase